MTDVFADTAYWIALARPRDEWHSRAFELSRGLAQSQAEVITTQEVLTEYLNYFADREPRIRLATLRNLTTIRTSSRIRIIPQSNESFEAGLALYSARPDKGYSLTDCISMETMRKEGLTDALTNDHHFEQEGFRALFRARTET